MDCSLNHRHPSKGLLELGLVSVSLDLGDESRLAAEGIV
jgi:hypothetical protein